MQQPLWLVVLALGLPCLAWGTASEVPLPHAPYSCRLEVSMTRKTPMQQLVENGTMTFGVFGFLPAVLTLHQEPKMGRRHSGFELTLSDQVQDMSINELQQPSWSSEGRTRSSDQAERRINLEDPPQTGRFFWVNVSRMAVSVGWLGEAEPLLAHSVQGEEKDDEPWVARFRENWNTHWVRVHNCSPTELRLPLACRKMSTTRSVLFEQSFPIEDEQVTRANSTTRAVRFMVQGHGNAIIRLHGKPNQQNYTIHIGLFKPGRIFVLPRLALVSERNCAADCLSKSELRLFTVTYNETHLEVFEGAEHEEEPRTTVKIKPIKFESVSFGSLGFRGPTHWLHACQEPLKQNLLIPAAEKKMATDSFAKAATSDSTGVPKLPTGAVLTEPPSTSVAQKRQ